MPYSLEMEFSDNTVVLTCNGPERLVDILHRPVKDSLWAVKWKFDNEVPAGISFHPSHKLAKKFAEEQINATAVSPMRLVAVSEWLYEQVRKNGFCWTSLRSFEEAEEYDGDTEWKH